ncbi:DUF3854 domain-containing protein (plasmid) [Clostridium beijerinckii]|uniref:DUF3854 domain-containing protein n=1 Tax=Clostridium beijerinckii TaxID=1520 RepID=UPI002227E8C3|nr:DUF3854 domain-containing protein [Clostridium beijerinckii]UYZ38963.1 DUF3854 domain-containing protein [Clostridium beijerinckii]
MGVTQYADGSWYPIRSGQTCPICGSKKGRCSAFINKEGQIVMYSCKYKESNRPSTNGGWYIHLANELSGDASQKFNINIGDYTYEPITDELLMLWDKVYRKFKSIFIRLNGGTALYESHKQDLINRGLDETTINNLGCFSVPKNTKINYGSFNCSLRTAIVNELLKSFKPETLIRVPGFKKAVANGKAYVTFKNTLYNNKTNNFEEIDGYFIPYFDYTSRFAAMQYRLMTPIFDENGKPMRYLWYSTKGVSCGSPINYHIPEKLELELEDVILITEGALKGKIASEIIGVRSLSEAGVSNYRKLVRELQLLEELENRTTKYKILLALDMDKYTNKDVLTAEINTVALLKVLGYSVTILEWDINEGKGIDDKLKKSKKGFRFLTV